MSQSASNGTVNENLEVATLGGGCFWCLEAVYVELEGVSKVQSGYAGGHVPNPTYRAVCDGTTGHAEVAQITFDPQITSFEEILQVFFVIHDPTTLNRQGNDIGTQYRSVIYYHDQDQKQTAEKVIAALTAEKVYDNLIVTEVSPLDTFYVAEDYHQDYYKYNSSQPYCQYVITPKVAKFRKKFAHKLATAA